MQELRSQRRQFWIIVIIVFFGFVGISMPYLIFPPLFLNLDYSFLPNSWDDSSRAIFLGITLAAYPIGQFIGSPILGALSDQHGRKKLLSMSLLITAVCNLFTGIAIGMQHLALLIISRFIAGLMEGNIAIARAMAADLKTISKHETFGKVNAATSIGYLVGPLVGGLMTDKNLVKAFTASTPFFFICILFFGLAALSSTVLKKSVIHGSKEIRTLWQQINFIKRMLALFSNKRLKILMIASTAFSLAVDMFYEFGPVYLTVKWALGPAQLIFYNAVLCLGLAIGHGWLSGFISSRISSRIPIISSIAVFALFLIGIVLTNSTLLMKVFFGFSGLIIGLVGTLLTVKISNSVSDAIQGEVMGTQISLRVLGDGLICLFGGALLIISPKLILILAALLSVATMIYYIIRYKLIKKIVETESQEIKKIN